VSRVTLYMECLLFSFLFCICRPTVETESSEESGCESLSEDEEPTASDEEFLVNDSASDTEPDYR
jgi:hypothetical protein